jgi:DNA-binding CsgD family transcriptional regulator/Tfp pilus assembly protein PilF
MEPLDRPVVCPVLVGRAPHLEALARCLRHAVERRGQTLLVAGEAGIGKSRFLAAARERAAQEGMAVLEGHCFESHHSLPYAPLIDLLRSAAPAGPGGSSAEQLVEVFGPGAPELVRILPELAPLVRDVAPEPEHPEQERHRLFRALLDGIGRLAAARPALVIVEDAHWSDDASLDFLAALARQVGTLPILLLISYRDDEVSPALSKLLAGLDRQRLAAELRLARLDRADVGEMLQSICGLRRPVRPELLDAIFSLTDGNPFFIEEVLRSLVAAGDLDLSTPDGAAELLPLAQLRVPRSVRDAVQRRAEQLSEAGRQTLELAAVAGQRFDVELLLALSGDDEAVLLRSIKELLAAGLLVEESADHFAFRHALTREAVRAGLLARERKALHRAIAEALEQAHGSDALEAHAADLALHAYEAEDWDRVLRYAPRAGERARALYAPRAALEHFTQALEATERLGVEPTLDLLRAVGQVRETLGEFEQARAAFETALEQARARENRRDEWQVLVDLGAAWMGRSYERGGQYYRQALELARQLGDDSRPLAYTLNCLGNWHANLEQPAEAVQHHHEALDLFRATGDRHGVAETLDQLGMASFLGGDLIAAQRYFEQALPHLRQLDHRQALSSALATLGISSSGGHLGDLMVLPRTEPNRPLRDAEAALEIAREIGWRAGEAYASSCVAITCLATGAYACAAESAGRGLSIAEELEHREWIIISRCAVGAVYLDLLAPAEARVQLELAVEAAPRTASPYWLRFSSALAALACVEQGDGSTADALLEGLVDFTRPPRTWAERVIWYARARLALRRGDPASALRLADELIAADPNISRLDARPTAGESTAPRALPLRRLGYLRGEALAALGRSAEAEQALLAARHAAADDGARPLLWRIEAVLGRVYAAQGRRLDADAAFAAARAIVEDLAAELPDSLRDSFLQRAHDLLPRPRPLTRRQAAKQAFGGLTARERDVALLVGQGNSNREIADALVLGERTVQTHVSHILEKLGFTSRAQIAAWAARQGLSSDPEPLSDPTAPHA